MSRMRIFVVNDPDRRVNQRVADTLSREGKQGCMDGLVRQMDLVREGKWNEQPGFAILHGS